MKVVLIGTGNVATVLGKKISRAGHRIVQVIGRDVDKTTLLASSLNSNATIYINNINREADIYIIAVADDYVKDIASNIKLDNRLIVHTAGALSMEVLESASTRYGILYPLQSLRKELEAPDEIPVLIDGNPKEVQDTLIEFASTWSNKVALCKDEERARLHVAAVIASNFTNHLYAIAEKFCNAEKLNFELLLPLIDETAKRLHVSLPSLSQTGPAARGDLKTIGKHKYYLGKYPGTEKLYDMLTESIIENGHSDKDLL